MKKFSIRSPLSILLILCLFLGLLISCSSAKDNLLSGITVGTENHPDDLSSSTQSVKPITPFIPATPPIIPDNEDFVKINDYIPLIFIDLRYSGENNVLGKKIYSYQDAYLRYGTVKKLKNAQEELEKEGLSLKIWEAYRPLDAQNTLSLILPNYATSPTKAYTAFNYGATLSLTIVKSDGSEIPMPSDFDTSKQSANQDSDNLSAEAAENATLLETIMEKYGFEKHQDKWHQYSDTDAILYPISPEISINENGLCILSDQWIVKHESAAPLFNIDTQKTDTFIADGELVNLLFFNQGKAYVKYQDSYGTVSAKYIVKTSEEYYTKDLLYINPKDEYSYSDMLKDARTLNEKYPEFIELSSIGESEEGRDLTLILLGNQDAEINIMIQASIHAREFITTTVLMSQIDYMLKNLDAEYELTGITFRELLDKICFHIVPMSNPDGVEIVQSGIISPLYPGKTSNIDLRQWKANAKGIDLNSNFDALWKNYKSPSTPSSEKYKGSAPECAAESKALADYVRNNPIDITLSYHTMGSVIYWDFPNQDKINDLNFSLSSEIVPESGFYLLSDPYTCAGFRDWAILQGIPSLTVEMGVGRVPSVFSEFFQIWKRSKNIIYETAIWAVENEAQLPNYTKS